MGRKCIIQNCPYYINLEKAKLHRFPAKLEAFNRWKKSIYREDLEFEQRESYRICDLHFDENMKFPDNKNRTNLIYGAYPTLHLGANSLLENLLTPSTSKKKPEKKPATEPIHNTEKNQRPKETQILHIVAEALKHPDYVFKSVKISTKGGPAAMCRICMKQADSLTASSETSPKFGKTFNELAEIIFPGINMKLYRDPLFCSRCIELLLQSYHLRTMWKSSEEIYSKINTKAKDIFIHPKQEDKSNALTHHDYIKEETCVVSKEKQEKKSCKSGCGTGPFLCSYCGKLYDQQAMFVVHLSQHRFDDKPESFRCEICDVFCQNVNRREHYESHAKPGPEKCTKCSKTFKIVYFCDKEKEKKLLEEKKQKPKPKKMSQCEICGKQVHGALAVHLLRHRKELWVKSCPICDKKFAVQGALKRHLAVHQEGVFPCDICGKVMKYKETLRNHVLVMHENRGNYRCTACDKTFMIRQQFIKHFRRAHVVGNAQNR